jgi:hypothetical protein
LELTGGGEHFESVVSSAMIRTPATLDDAIPLVTGARIKTSSIPWTSDDTPPYMKFKGHHPPHLPSSTSTMVHGGIRHRQSLQRDSMPALFPLDKANDSQFAAIMLVSAINTFHSYSMYSCHMSYVCCVWYDRRNGYRVIMMSAPHLYHHHYLLK